jgi:hypothetical protein
LGGEGFDTRRHRGLRFGWGMSERFGISTQQLGTACPAMQHISGGSALSGRE